MISKLTGLVTTLALSALVNGAALAQIYETSFTYNGLYKSIKTASANEFSQVSLNFYLLKKDVKAGESKVCPVESGYISDGEHTMDLIVTDRGQMLLPLDKSLKQDHAAITIITPQQDMCQLKMQIEVASFELPNASVRSLNGWTTQITALYEKLAGWPGRYFMPNLVGLTFTFSDVESSSAYLVTPQGRQLLASAKADKLYFSLDDLSELPADGQLQFSSELTAVTPRLAQ